MTANTREMTRVEVKRAHNDWARLGRGELELAEEPRAFLEGLSSLPLFCYQQKGNGSLQLRVVSRWMSRLWS